jgi:uncharacterized damage-inducible protein DinB
MTDSRFQKLNEESLERLAHLVAGLAPSQLEVDLGEGWTVASALAGRWSAQEESMLAAEHLANEALHPYWAGVAAVDLPVLALDAATKLNAIIASAPDDVVDSLEGTPSAYLLHRHNHRGDHLDHIDRALAAAAVPLDRSFVERNAVGRRRLASLVERLRESELTLPTEEGGWTVAQVLGHMAFWDRSMETRWRLATAAADGTGTFEPAGFPGELTDAVNLPLAELVGSWTGRIGIAIGAEALAAAESVDALVADLADRLPGGLAAQRPNLVDRWMHRESHLDQLERALAASRPSAAPVDRSFAGRNETSLTGLRELLAGLSAADVARPTGDGGWTVGQILGHLTFWDRFLAARWRAALAGGRGGQPAYLPHELADLLNDGLPPTWQAFASGAGGGVIAEALAAAEDVDGMIAGLPEATPIDAILAERPALLDRSIHRREHVEQIEKLLGARLHDIERTLGD